MSAEAAVAHNAYICTVLHAAVHISGQNCTEMCTALRTAVYISMQTVQKCAQHSAQLYLCGNLHRTVHNCVHFWSKLYRKMHNTVYGWAHFWTNCPEMCTALLTAVHISVQTVQKCAQCSAHMCLCRNLYSTVNNSADFGRKQFTFYICTVLCTSVHIYVQNCTEMWKALCTAAFISRQHCQEMYSAARTYTAVQISVHPSANLFFRSKN